MASARSTPCSSATTRSTVKPRPALKPISAGPPASFLSWYNGESSGRRSRQTPRPDEEDWCGDVEFLQCRHLPVEPNLGIGPVTVGPTQAGSEVAHAQPPQPAHGIVQSM